MGYSLKKTQKIKPGKKIPETDAIFANVAIENQISDQKENSLRISIDSKAKVKIGNLSGEGKGVGTIIDKIPKAYFRIKFIYI